MPDMSWPGFYGRDFEHDMLFMSHDGPARAGAMVNWHFRFPGSPESRKYQHSERTGLRALSFRQQNTTCVCNRSGRDPDWLLQQLALPRRSDVLD